MEGKLTEGEATREGKLREGEAAGAGREGALHSVRSRRSLVNAKA